MAKKILSIVLALTLALSVFTVAASAATINSTADSFVADFKAAVNGDVVALAEDVTISGNLQTTKAITLDLNGHEITITGSNGIIASGKTADVTIIDSVGGGAITAADIAFQAQNGGNATIEAGTFTGRVRCVGNAIGVAGVLTINDGTFNSRSTSTSAIQAYRSGKVVINDGTINGDVYVQNNGKLDVNGGTFTSENYCIVTNGTESGQVITINDGTFTATSSVGAAAYLPGGANVTINGGTFTGADALYIKSGTTIIKGGTFVGNGDETAYKYNGSGFYATGDAIVVDSCGYPKGTPVVRIYDGEFSSENAASVKGYTYGSNVAPVISIFGGEFDDNAAETYPAYAVYNSTQGTSYAKFEAAAQAAVAGDTLVIFEDVAVGAYTAVTDVTIDLSGNDITSTGNAPLDVFGTITVKDSIGGGKIAGAQRGIWVNAGSTTTISNAEVDGVVVDGGALTLTNAYIDGYVATSGVGSSVSVTGTTTTVTGQVAVAKGTLTINNGTFADVFVYDGSTATIKNGTYDHISVYDNAVATINNGTFGTGYFATGGSATVKKGTFNGQINISDGGALTIDGGTFNDTIVPVGGWPVKGDDAATAAKAEYVSTLVVNDGTFTTKGMCISGNGTDVGTADITINGGKFVAYGADSAAIYQPQSGNLTINGGSFYGSDALYLKSGTTVINGGTFKGRGAKADYKYYGSGFYSTGDTIVVDSCGYPGGAPALTINGGSFFSDNNEIIGYYVHGDNNLESTGFVVDGTFGKTVPSIYYADPTTFTLFQVNGGKATVDGTTVTILADQGSEKIEVLKKATDGSIITFSDCTGGATISKDEQLYARTNGTAKAYVDGTEYTVQIVFQSFDVAELLVVDNATVSISGSEIILSAGDDDVQIKVAPRTTADTYIEVGTLTGGAKVSKSGTLYAKADGTAVVTVPNAGTYTVVFDFDEDVLPLVELLRITNATAAVNGTTITLTPVNAEASESLVCKLMDGTPITFSNLNGAKISKNGSLYANSYATATATIGDTDYTVVFNYEVPEVPEVALADNLRVTNATVTVIEDSIILAPVDDSAKITFVPKTLDGKVIDVLSTQTKVSKNGTLYTTEYGEAEVYIDGETYTVRFDFPQEAAPTAEELIKVAGATVSVDGTTITLAATGTKVSVYPTLKDGSTATFEKGTAKVSKSGTLYATADATATMTIAGVDYTVNFVF